MKIFFSLQRFQTFDNATPNKTITGTNDSDSIKNSGAIVKIYGGGGSDTVDNSANLVTVSGGADNDSVKNSGSNVRISLDAGDDKVYNNGYNATDIKIYGGAGDDSVYNYYSNKVSIYSGMGNDTIENYSGSNVTIYGGSADDKIYSRYGSNVNILGESGNDYIYSYSYGNNSISGGSGNDTIHFYAYYYDDNAKTDTVSGGKGDDIMSLSGSSKTFVQYTVGDGNDTIFGFGADDTLQITTNKKFTSTPGGNDLYFIFDNGSITLKNTSSVNVVTIKGGNTDDGGSDSDSDSGGDSDSGVDTGTKKIFTVSASFSGTTIDLTTSKYKKYIGVNASKYKKKGLEIFGNAKNNTLIGGSKNDTLSGGKGTDTLTGGGGSDIFIHSGGIDIITDYTAQDMIYLDKTSIIGTSFFVNDLMLYTSDNSYITVKNGKDKQITTFDSTGVTVTKKYGALPTGLTYSKNNTIITADKNFAGDKIDLADYVTTVKTVNAAAVTENIEIIGNKLNNSLVGGKGSDTIAGGAGNDTMTGNGGRDIFVYSTGDDVITDYTAGKDKIKLSGVTIKNEKISNNNIVFTTSKGTLKLKGAAGKAITIIDDDGNERTQRYAANLSEIIAENSVGEFENYNEKISQESLITFTK